MNSHAQDKTALQLSVDFLKPEYMGHWS